MNPATLPPLNPKQLVRILWSYRTRWLLPALAATALAGAYATLAPATWEASQALVVRNEAANNQSGPGKFGRTEDMKNVQETILELVKSHGVLAAALSEVGPAPGRSPDRSPTDRDVAELRDAIKLAPPKGIEFGTTEVFYLKARADDRARAIALNEAICGQLQARFQQLRDAKAQSMIDELVKAAHLAKADLAASTQRLTEIETQVGSDLTELRSLNDTTVGESALQRTTTEIRNELRQIRATAKANEQLHALLKAAQDDPGRLVATPNQLLESQPALRRLKEGLVDAQLRTAALRGRMQDEHPLVQASLHGEDEVGRHLHNELSIALRGVELELRANADREALLTGQLAQVTGRLGRLAELRAKYSNLAAENLNRARLVERAEQNLAEAHTAQASAKATSLISRLDAPDAGIRPLGPSRAMIVLLGLCGGLLVGFGVLFLTVPSVQIAPTNAAPAPRDPATAEVVLPRRTEPVATPATPVFAAGDGLSLKQALQKIGYNGKI